MAWSAWNAISGKESFIPQSTSNYDEVKLEVGKPFQYRIIGEPFIYREHKLDGFKDGNETVRFVRCAKTHDAPDAECPLCDADAPLRNRVVCNVFSYADNAVKTLNVGMKCLEVVGQMVQMGMSIENTKFATTKNGKGLNTTYITIQCGIDNTPITEEIKSQCKNLEELYRPHTQEEIKNICEGIGLSYEQATTPPELEYPTLAEARNHVLEFGKHKGKTLGEVWDSDRSPNGYVGWLATKSKRYNPTKASAMVIYQFEGGFDLGIKATPK